MTDDKVLLLKMHDCAKGLSEEVVREIANECELMKVDSGEFLHQANQPFDSIYMVIHGRAKSSLLDIRGNVISQREETAGGQFGALAAALGEPLPLDVVAIEPTTLLRLNYQKALALTKQHDAFRQNFTRSVAESVRSLVLKDRRPKRPGLVSIFHQSPATRELTRKLIQRIQQLGENPCVLNDQSDWQPMKDVPYRCLIQNGTYLTERDVRDQINHWTDSRRIVVDVDATIEYSRISNIIEVSEMVFWCVTPDHWKASIDRLKSVLVRAPNWREKINVVWLLNDGSQLAPLVPELNQLAKRDFKLSFNPPAQNRSRELVNGFERIIHQLRGVRIGVALGGGAARGMAHLGVLKALEQNGIFIDMIAGTSAGAMTGILYASGLEPDYNIGCFVKDLTPSWPFRQLPNGGYWYLLFKYRRRQFDPMLRKYLKDARLEQLVIPVQSITVDLISGKAIVREQGDAVHAITESINLPVLSAPINRDGRALVDGGIVNNVPADVLASKGCNFVIAVSVTARMKQEFATNQPDTPTSNMKQASTLQTIMRTYLVQNVNMNSVGVQPADFVIEPDVIDFDITEFTRADEMAAIGEQATLAAVPKIKSLLAQIDKQLFPCE